MSAKKDFHGVYELNYRVVLVTKQRRPCISNAIGDFLIQEAAALLNRWDGEVLEGKAGKDHISLLISMNPKHELATYIGVLKQSLARAVRKAFPQELDKALSGPSFWSDSYYICSVGEVDEEAVAAYIKKQGQPKRKYVKQGNKKQDPLPPDN